MRDVRTVLSFVAVAAALSLVPGTARAQAKGKPIDLSVGDMHFTYHPDSGVKLFVFGIPMLKSSSIYFMKPGWTGKYYSPQDNPNILSHAKIESYKGGKRVTLTHTLPKEFDSPVAGKAIYTLLPGNTYTVTQEFTFTKKEPAIVEWQAGAVNPAPMIGCPYTVEENGKKTRGVIPPEAKSGEVQESTFGKAFSRLTIDSRIGPVTIESDPANDIILFDYRKNKWAKASNPYFWLGALERPITAEKKYDYTVTMRFPKTLTPVSSSVPLKETEVKAVAVDDAESPNWGQNYIIPKPKSLVFHGAPLPLSSKTQIYVGDKPGKGIDNALDFFLTELKNTYTIEPKVIRKSVAAGDVPKDAIVLGEVKRYDVPASVCKNHGLALPKNDEGYVLHVGKDGAFVAGNTVKGVFYGLTTLLQLVQVNDAGISLKGADIVDYPSLKFRGVHFLSAKNGGDQIAKAVRTLLARFKINSLVFECEYIIWKGHHDIASSQYGMSIADAKKVAAAAKKYFVDVIPLVQSLGHSEWVFTNNKNLDLAEDPETPYAYDPTNPATYKFIFGVFQQAIDLFHPRYFHIGHDEVTNQARFPWRSRKSGKSVTQLVTGDIVKLHDWLKERHIRTMMWGDMFLSPGESPDACNAPNLEVAKKRRSLLPKDIVITDWHYAAAKPAEYKSIKIWHDDGFETIGAGWDNPTNIRNLNQAGIQNNAFGYLQTTWAGFNFKIDNNEVAWPQYWAYILAAYYAWSGDTTPAYDLPFSAKEKFLDAWFGRKPLLHKRSGYVLDLKPVLNRRLADNAKGQGWLGYGADFDFSALPTGNLHAGETLFDIQKNADGDSALLLAGRFNPKGVFPREVKLDVKPVRAESIHFLMNTAFRTVEKARVGRITVAYTDGSTASTDLIYGKNIFAFYDARVGENTRIAWEGNTAGNRKIDVWDLAWTNPHPGKTIRSVSVESAGTEASPILFAATLVSPAQ